MSNNEKYLLGRFSINLKAFEKYYPSIAKPLKNYTPLKTFDFIYEENNSLNIKFTDTNCPFYNTNNVIEYSKEQVLKFINENSIQNDSYSKIEDKYGQISFKYTNRLVNIDNENIKSNELGLSYVNSIANCIMVGCGLGYQIAELYERIEIHHLTIIEPNIDLFYASLFCFDWKNLLVFINNNGFGINFIIGKHEDILDRIYSYFSSQGLFLLSSRTLYIHYENQDILDCMKQLVNLRNLTLRQGNIDGYLFGVSHGCYAILNQKKFITTQKINKKICDYPVFVIGSGPSLDDDVPFIRKNQDKAIIIACGTAIDSLYHLGIKPDIYANTEREPYIKDTLEAIPDKKFLDDIILMASDVCHPNTLSCFKHVALFSKGNEPLMKCLKMTFKSLQNLQDIYYMNPLVGNMGVSGAIYLGFRNIYLFGIDNGKRKGRTSIHSAHVSLYKKMGVSDSSGAYIVKTVTAGNFGTECDTNTLYQRSTQNIGLVIEKNAKNNVVCFNCSDGALIPHTVSMHSYELSSKFNNAPQLDKHYIKQQILKKTRTINISKQQIEDLFDMHIFKNICEKITDILNKKVQGRMELLKQMSLVSKELNTNQAIKHFQSSFLDCSLQTFFIEITHALYGNKDEVFCVNVANQMIDCILDFLKEAPDFFMHMPYYIKGEHKKYFSDGKVGKDMPHCSAPKFPILEKIIKFDYVDPQNVFEKKY